MSHDQRRHGDPALSITFAEAAAAGRFALIESELGDGRCEIKVEGDLDLAVSGRLQQAIAECPGEQILISLESCRFIDSSGIAVIVKARAEHPGLVVHSPRDQVRRVLELTGVAANGLVVDGRGQAMSTAVQPVAS